MVAVEWCRLPAIVPVGLLLLILVLIAQIGFPLLSVIICYTLQYP